MVVKDGKRNIEQLDLEIKQGKVQRTILICSEKEDLDNELDFIKKVFKHTNGYPSRVIENTLFQVNKKLEKEKEIQQRNENEINTDIRNQEKEIEIHPHISLPFRGQQGNNIIKNLRKKLDKCLPQKIKPRFTYTGKKIGSFFPIKDKIKQEHLSNITYGYTRNKEIRGCKIKDYIGETNVRFETRTQEHKSQKQSSIYKHAAQNDYNITEDDFEILDMGYKHDIDRKIGEALFIKEFRPKLNEQNISLKLQLFN